MTKIIRCAIPIGAIDEFITPPDRNRLHFMTGVQPSACPGNNTGYSTTFFTYGLPRNFYLSSASTDARDLVA